MWERELYSARFSKVDLKRREDLWKTLVKAWLGRYVRKTDTVVDVGAGFGEFLRVIDCRTKVAIDRLSPANLEKVGIRVINKNIQSIGQNADLQADVVLLCNVLEHLPTITEVLRVLQIVKSVLKPDGKLLIIQPVIDLVGVRYWDFLDHQVVLSRASLKEALVSCGFRINEFVPRFLPYTTKSRFPIFSWMIWVYLWLPWYLRPGAGQCFCVAVPEGREKHR